MIRNGKSLRRPEQLFGNLTNYIYAKGHAIDPEVGMGVTRLSWTDRFPYVITEVKQKTLVRVAPLVVDMEKQGTVAIYSGDGLSRLTQMDTSYPEVWLKKVGAYWREVEAPKIPPKDTASYFHIGTAMHYFDVSF